MVEKNIRLKTHLGNGVYDTLHPETNSKIVRVGDKNLDETLGEVTAHLAQNEQRFDIEMAQNILNDEQLRAYVDLLQLQVTSMGDISPEPFGTYNDLVSTNPSHSGVYVVTSDGKWYYWNSIGNLWDAGGDFQAAGISNGSVTTEKVATGAITREKMADTYGDNGMKLSGSVNINTYYKDGGTILAAPIQGTLPTDYNKVNAGFLINVSGYSTCLQILFYMTDKNIFWTRFVNTANSQLSSWTKGFGSESIENKSLGFSKLSKNFRDGGIVTGNVDSLSSEGSYLMTPPYVGLPDILMSAPAVVVDVSVTSGEWITQVVRNLYGKFELYTRSFRDTSPMSQISGWRHILIDNATERKLLFLGDSIPAISDYPKKIQENTGITVVNGAIGGTTFATHAQEKYNPFTGSSLVEAIVSGDWTTQDTYATTIGAEKLTLLKNIDLSTYTDVVFAYGTNDAYSITIPGEVNDTNVDTYSGAINTSLETLLTAYPHLQVLLVSPIYRSRYEAGDGKNSDDFPAPSGHYLRDFVDVLIRQGEKHHVPVLNLYDSIGVNKYNSSFFLNDGLHPTNPAGRDRLANVVGSFLTSTY